MYAITKQKIKYDKIERFNVILFKNIYFVILKCDYHPLESLVALQQLSMFYVLYTQTF